MNLYITRNNMTVFVILMNFVEILTLEAQKKCIVVLHQIFF